MGTILTEQKIQRALRKFFSPSNIRYEMDGLYVFLWESDKLLVTKAGVIYEFEIKISRADYQNDFKHKAKKHLLLQSALPELPQQTELFDNYMAEQRKKYPGITPDQCREKLRESLPERRRIPNYFFYAVPDGMLQPDEIPPYAGLVYVSEEGRIMKTIHGPRLHNKKYTDVELGLCEKFYYNMRTAIRTAEYCQEDRDRMKAQLDEELASKGKDMTYSQLELQYKDAVSRRDTYQKSAENYKNMYFTMVEGADHNSIERRLLINEIKKHDPDFDYQRIMSEAERIYDERYPKKTGYGV